MCEIQNKIVKFFNFSEKSFCVIGTADDINLSDLLRLGFSKYYLSDEQRVCWMCFGVRTKFSILWTIFMARSLLDMAVCVLLPITRQAFEYVQMNLQLMVFMLPVTRRPLLKKPFYAIRCQIFQIEAVKQRSSSKLFIWQWNTHMILSMGNELQLMMHFNVFCY